MVGSPERDPGVEEHRSEDGVIVSLRRGPHVFLVVLASCGHDSGPAQHVELTPLPVSSTREGDSPTPQALEEPSCKPADIVAIESDSAGVLDMPKLREALSSAQAFAQRCCNGDEAGDASVRVTLAPAGYETSVSIEPERLASAATGACIHAIFHRVVTRSFSGSPFTVTVPVHVHP